MKNFKYGKIEIVPKESLRDNPSLGNINYKPKGILIDSNYY